MEDKYLSVTALTRYIKYKLDNDKNLQEVYLRGEISNFKAHTRGHYYFTIKDENSRINAIMFSFNASKLKFMPEDGMKVLVKGKISVFESTGNYQIYISDMLEDGVGNLHIAFEQLKKNWLPVFLRILSGVITNLGLIYILCILFKIGHVEYISLLPKSLTTAIAFSLTEQYSGIVPITAVMVIIAGNIGNLFAVQICRIVRITEPVAVGVAIGTCSHALGTSKAIEIGDVEGAISGLSIAITGLLTVLFFPLFANLI